jgi:peroxiredoxin
MPIGIARLMGGPWSRLLTVAITVLAAVVLVQNLSLLRQINVLRLRAAATDLKLGRQVKRIVGLQAGGGLSRIVFPQSQPERMLVLAISAHCQSCKENHPRYKALAAKIRARGNWSVIWVSRSELESSLTYAAENGIPINELVADPLHETHQALGLEAVPHVIVLDKYGIVQGVWRGNQPWTEDRILAATYSK